MFNAPTRSWLFAFYSETLQKGTYLQALADGIHLSLKPYRIAMVELEQRFLDTPTYSLMFLFTELNRFDELFRFLLHFLAGIRTERLVIMMCIIPFTINRINVHLKITWMCYLAISPHKVFTRKQRNYWSCWNVSDLLWTIFDNHFWTATSTATLQIPIYFK